ncbi:MAG: hypothetical protein IJQ99_09740 [Synergistaceae bacterium]|nr:hypothetical protein [Synergistaceae bacterium]MBR0317136.1 hypothetical protein [Synergistaceae bacterium]
MPKLTKIFDAKVKVGEYTTNEGQKNKWEAVGSVLKNEKGNFVFAMKKTFNPAGVPSNPNDVDIYIPFFPPNQK